MIGALVVGAARGVYGWRWLVLPPVAGLAVMAMIVGALIVAPPEAIEGDVQRLLYLHARTPTVFSEVLALTQIEPVPGFSVEITAEEPDWPPCRARDRSA